MACTYTNSDCHCQSVRAMKYAAVTKLKFEEERDLSHLNTLICEQLLKRTEGYYRKEKVVLHENHVSHTVN